MSSDVAVPRAARALAITLALVLLVPAVGALGELVHDPVEYIGGMDEGGISARKIVEGGDPSVVLLRVEEAAKAGSVEAPVWFATEVGVPSDFRDFRVDSSGEVVGFVVDGEPREVMSALGERMVEAGWSMVSLGGVEGATFMKEGGECTWLLVSCVQVGDATSVVFRRGDRASP